MAWLSVLLTVPSLAGAQTQRATVISIGDGDTIRVQQDGRKITVRLASIDAPEMAQSPHGQRARDYLQLRVPIGSQVRLDVKTTDRYGLTVAEVFSGSNINLAMVEDGQAFAYRRYLDQCDKREYLEAEDRASRRRLGVWQVPGGITRPWDFRRSRRYTCSEIGSHARAQELLRQGHTYLDGNRDGEACESLR